MSSFTFSDCPTTLVLADAERDGKKVATGSLSLTVRNVTNRSLIGTLRVEPDDMAQSGWFKIADAAPTSPAERDIDCEANATQTVQVDIAVPEGAPAGRKVFTLRVATERDPDNDFTDSPAVAFEVKAPAPKVVQKKPFPWWIAAVAVVAVAVVGGVFWALRPSAPPPPPPAPTNAANKPTVPTGIKGKDLQTAINQLGTAGIPVDLNDLVRQLLTRPGGPGRFQIFDVAPSEGASIGPNQQVKLTVGQIVPNDLKDADLQTALDRLRKAGIDVDTRKVVDQLYHQGPANKPQVDDVQPHEGGQIKPGATIVLTIKRTVPKGLKNQDLPTVIDRLTDAGIFIDVRDLLDKVATFPKGQKLVVSGLSPDEGQTIKPTDRVRLTIIGR